MGNNARWWSQKSATASLCRTKEHVIEAKTNEPNATACPGSCISSDDFSVFEVPGVDYAALFDRTGSAIIIWVVSMVADVFVIGYHVKNRPHPKFTTTSPRMVSITIHSMSGAGECVAGLWTAFLVGDQRLAMIYYMSIFSLFHILTAVFQTDIVFGAKKIMIPCYLCAVLFKMFCWWKLISNMVAGNSELLILSWFLSLELIHHIYVWVRVIIYFTTKIRLFRKNQYTISILMAGQICVYPALGALGMVFFYTFVVVYQPLWRCWVHGARQRLFYEAELDRNPFFSDLYRGRAVETMKVLGKHREYDQNTTFRKELAKRSEEERIASAFKILDLDDSGFLTLAEIENMLINWGCPESDAHSAMERLGLLPEEHIDVKLFMDKFYDVWSFCLVSLEELARHLDFKTVYHDGALMPFQYINAHTIFNDHTDKFAERKGSIQLTNPLASSKKLIKYEEAEKRRKSSAMLTATRDCI